ncbi:13939_t:CDS:2 [Entrophospora sp. SA101]|nr:13939_t:CDS:2 [Entrophospora sp. SA101]
MVKKKDLEFEKHLQKIEDPSYQREINRALPLHATPLQTTKYQLCKKILGYKLKNNLSREQVAEKINLSKAETEDILFCEIEKFTLDRLTDYASKLFAPCEIELSLKSLSPTILEEKKAGKLETAYREAWIEFPKKERQKKLHTIQEEHPAVIISNNKQNQFSSVITVLPITSQLDKTYPFEVLINLDKPKINEELSSREGDNRGMDASLEGRELDLRKKPKLTYFNSFGDQLTNLDLSKCPDLVEFYCTNSALTSIEFLNTLPNPKKVTKIRVFNNNIEPTNISFFEKFENLICLKTGTENICIEATDVNEGLEYLPLSLGKGYGNIECYPHNTNAKCSAIKEQLSPFDYDVLA